MADFDMHYGFLMICDNTERELAGKAICALRKIGKDAKKSRVITFLVSESGCTKEDAVTALDVLKDTEQAIVTTTENPQDKDPVEFWNLNEAFIHKYGYPEHKLPSRKHPRQTSRRSVKKKLSTLRRVEKPQLAKVEPEISVQDDIKVLKQILMCQPDNTVVKSLCRSTLRSRGVGQNRQDRLFRKVESDSLVRYGVRNSAPTITWVEPKAKETYSYIIVKRPTG